MEKGEYFWYNPPKIWLSIDLTFSQPVIEIVSGDITGDGDRKSLNPCAPMIWDNFSIFRTNCAILTSYVRADPRTCGGFRVDVVTLPDQNGVLSRCLIKMVSLARIS